MEGGVGLGRERCMRCSRVVNGKLMLVLVALLLLSDGGDDGGYGAPFFVSQPALSEYNDLVETTSLSVPPSPSRHHHLGRL